MEARFAGRPSVFRFKVITPPPRCFDSAQGPGSSEQARAPEGPGEEEEGPSSQGSEGGPGGPQEEERPGDRAHEETTEAGAGKRGGRCRNLTRWIR